MIRNLVLYGAWCVVDLTTAAMGTTNPSGVASLNTAAFLVAFALLVQVAVTASRSRPSLHDRLAGTRVILLPRPDQLEAAGLRPTV